MSKLNAFKVNWKVLLALLVIAWLVNTVAFNVVETLDLSSGAHAVLLVLNDVSHIAFVILLLVVASAAALAGIKLVAKLFPSLFDFGTDQPEVIPEADRVSDTLADLGRRLDDIERNRDQAIVKLQDANLLASTLVNLIRRTVAKSKSLMRECQLLENALEALVSGDPLHIAQAAGQLDDDHIRNLMLETNGDESYRNSVIHLVATQTGATRSSANALSELSNAWIESLTSYRAQTARLSVVIDVLDAARPLSSLDTSLRVAQSFLMMKDKPELHQVTRMLPASTTATSSVTHGYK